MRATEPTTSGEAEFAIVVHDGVSYVTIASDHTDRAAECVDVSLSKRVCPKILGLEAWQLDEVLSHWDSLELRSWIETDRARRLYQSGSVAQLLSPSDLLHSIPWRERPTSFVVLGGTIPTISGLECTDRFIAELCDPRSRRSLTLDYRIVVSNPLRS